MIQQHAFQLLTYKYMRLNSGSCLFIQIQTCFLFVRVGRELTLPQQYAAIGVASIPILWIVGAGGAVFWVIGKCCDCLKLGTKDLNLIVQCTNRR